MKSVLVLILFFFTYMASASDAQRRACVTAVCGSMDSIRNHHGVGSFQKMRPPEVKALIARNLKVMGQIMDIEIENHRLRMAGFDHFQTMFSMDSLSEPEQAMMGMLAFLSFDLSNLDSRHVIYKNGSPALKPSMVDEVFPNTTPEQKAWLVEITNAIIKSDWTAIANQVESRPYDYLLKLLDVEDAEKRKEWGHKLVNSATSSRAELGRRSINGSEMKLFAKLAAGVELNPFEKKALSPAIAKLYSQQNVNDKDMRAIFAKNPFTIAQILAMSREKINDFKTILNSDKKLAPLRKKLIDTCSKNIAASAASGATPAELKLAQQISESVKASARAVLPKYLTGLKLEIADDAVRRAHFMLPLGRESLLGTIDQYFVSALADARELVSLKTSMDVKQERIELLLDMLLIGQKDKTEGHEESYFRILNQACENIEPPGVTDSVLTNTGSIVMSWQSAKWPGMGAGVMAHELGHVVASVIKKEEDLRDTLACQEQQHRLVYTDNATTENQSEDFADNFSITVQKHLQQTWPFTKNFGCLLLSVDRKTKDFEVAALDLAEDSGMGHSAPMFRLLQLQAGRGALPPECSSLSEIEDKPFAACAK